MKLSRKGKYLLGAVLLLGFLIGAGFYTHVHSVTLEEAHVESKKHEDDKYSIIVNGKELYLEDEKTWNLIEENATYHIEYEYYGLKEPVIQSIEEVEE